MAGPSQGCLFRPETSGLRLAAAGHSNATQGRDQQQTARRQRNRRRVHDLANVTDGHVVETEDVARTRIVQELNHRIAVGRIDEAEEQQRPVAVTIADGEVDDATARLGQAQGQLIADVTDVSAVEAKGRNGGGEGDREVSAAASFIDLASGCRKTTCGRQVTFNLTGPT